MILGKNTSTHPKDYDFKDAGRLRIILETFIYLIVFYKLIINEFKIYFGNSFCVLI
ncbi:hypothetical protein BN1088_1500053 [Sphingobacterium sp. PM2-P1-29]|nr:hypothetical protein BN1088_1500053 [Sphingobacterium sp. PM2-P1-29]